MIDREANILYDNEILLIGLLSDTHIPEAAKELPPELMEAFRGVDLILHAGDIYMPSVLDDLERIAPVLTARGDDDYIFTDKRVEEKHVLKLGGKTLWLIHDRKYGLSPSTVSSSASEFLPRWPKKVSSSGQEVEDKPDIVVFGHEHRTIVETLDGVLFINPGSPTFLNYQRGLGTVGILDINSGGVDVRIVQL